MIDARRLTKSAEVDVGPEPASVAYSSAARAAYVTSGKGDKLAVVDGDPPAVTARVAIGGGATSVRFGPGGRLAFVTHPDRDEVSVVDASVNRLVRTIEAAGVPDQVAFSDRLAYIRPRESPMVRLVPLDGVAGGGSTTTVLDVPGGQHPLGQGASPCRGGGHRQGTRRGGRADRQPRRQGHLLLSRRHVRTRGELSQRQPRHHSPCWQSTAASRRRSRECSKPLPGSGTRGGST